MSTPVKRVNTRTLQVNAYHHQRRQQVGRLALVLNALMVLTHLAKAGEAPARDTEELRYGVKKKSL